jgi:hypothetical protein
MRWKNAVSYPIEVTNTNSAIIKIFLDFLRYDLKIDEEKIRLQIQVHAGDSVEELEDYWGQVTAIPKERFNKTIIRPAGRKAGKSKGTCKVRFTDKKTYQLLEFRLQATLKGVYESSEKLLTIYEPGHTEASLLK